jgi:hypothetical protein
MLFYLLALAVLAAAAFLEVWGVIKLASMLRHAKREQDRLRNPTKWMRKDGDDLAKRRVASGGRLRMYGPLSWISGELYGDLAARIKFGPSEGDAHMALATDLLVPEPASDFAQILIINGVTVLPDTGSIRVDRKTKIVTMIVRKLAASAVATLKGTADSLATLARTQPCIAFAGVSR